MHQIFTPLLDAVFPPHCVACKRVSSWWCIECRLEIELIRREVCPGCAHAGGSHECPVSSPLDTLTATGFYHDPNLRAAITALKYQGATCLMDSIKEYLDAWRGERFTPWPWHGAERMVLAPVPTTPQRKCERGFDQAELLSEAVREICVPWATPMSLIKRSDEGEAQASLGHNDLRRANVEGAFTLASSFSLLPSVFSVILVDDVFTTGSTMHEAARVLQAAGVQKIHGFVLAVGA